MNFMKVSKIKVLVRCLTLKKLIYNKKNKCGLIYGRDLVFLDKFNFGVSGLSGNLWLMEKWELKNIFNFLLKGKIMAVPAILFSLMKYGRRCALTKKNKGKGNK